jgi:HlyD family secretion protein
MSQTGPDILTPTTGVTEESQPGRAGQPEGPLTGIRNMVSQGKSSRSRNRKRLKYFAAAIVLIALGAVLRFTVLAPKPVPAEVVRVTRGIVEQTITNTRAGTVKARRRARLSPETGGRVVELPHREGARVKKGTLLLRLDASIQKAQLDLSMEDVRVAEARAEEACLAAQLAETELERAKALFDSGITSSQVVDTRSSERDRTRAGCNAARATLDQARAREQLSRADLARTEIFAPFDGIVAEVSTELGEWITPAPPGVPLPPIMDLLDPTSAYIAAPIDEMDAEEVAVGQEVRITVDSRRGESFPGRLVRVAPYVLDVVEQNRTIEVEADLLDGEVAASLFPGTSADIEIILKRREDVLQIPTGALGPGNKVLVVVEGRLEERTVATGLGNWRRTEIVEGLREGEMIVTSRDSPDIQPGVEVAIREES